MSNCGNDGLRLCIVARFNLGRDTSNLYPNSANIRLVTSHNTEIFEWTTYPQCLEQSPSSLLISFCARSQSSVYVQITASKNRTEHIEFVVNQVQSNTLTRWPNE